jgi:type 1 glutamine amidotransferase
MQLRILFLILATITSRLPGAAKADDPAVTEKITAACSSLTPVKAAKERKALVFSHCEGFKHACIPVFDKAMAILGQKTGAFTATFAKDYDVFDAAKLAEYDVLILNNTTGLKIPEGAPRQALLDFVRNGKGIVGLHGAVDNFKNFPEALAMMGGVFNGHPWTAGGTWRFRVDDATHPLNAGFKEQTFSVKDEIYQFNQKITSRANVRVLTTLDFSDETTATANKGKQCRQDGDYAVTWIRPEGKGRVFYFGFGHNDDIAWNVPLMAHCLAGIQYAIGDLKADDIPKPK